MEDVVKILEKKHGFVQHPKFMQKGFVNIFIKGEQLFIGHDIPKYGKLTLIPELNALGEYISYFNRI